MKLFLVLLGLCCLHQAFAATHSLKYFYTASSGITTFPEFVIVGLVDDVPFYQYDSNSQKVVPKQDWLNKVTEGDPQYFQTQTQLAQGTEQQQKNNVAVAKERFNQTGGVHTVQFLVQCQWNSNNDATTGDWQYGFDGEDFISLDLKNKRFIAPLPESVITKNKWDSNRANIDYMISYLTSECVDWLKKYVQYGRSTLESKVRPEVSLLQKDSSTVVCHATGFYPEGVMISWKKEGDEIQEEVNVGETLPNSDGTFQKRAELTVSREEWKKSVYTCEVAHRSGEPIIVILNEDVFQRNNPDDASIPITGIVVGLLVAIVLIAVIAGFVLLRKKKKSGPRFTPADTDDSSQSDNGKA